MQKYTEFLSWGCQERWDEKPTRPSFPFIQLTCGHAVADGDGPFLPYCPGCGFPLSCRCWQQQPCSTWWTGFKPLLSAFLQLYSVLWAHFQLCSWAGPSLPVAGHWLVSLCDPFQSKVKPRPSDECVRFWPRGHQGGLWLMLSRCWKGLICFGERGLAAVSRVWDTTPSGCLCEGSSCARQGKRNEMQLLRSVASSALPLLNASQRLLQLWKTCS